MNRFIFFALIFLLNISLYAKTVAIRGSFFDFVDDPWNFPNNENKAVRFYPDGLLVIEEGKIKDFGEFASLKEKYSSEEITDYSGKLILPGFIDCHIHYPQTAVIASYGDHLLAWLQKYIFPEELKFKNIDYARHVASRFFDNILQNGTTTVQSFATTAPQSVEAFFNEATSRNMRVICGLTGLDRKGQAPDDYLDTAESFYTNSKQLIKKFHRKGRNLYAITPRYALGSTAEQLERCQKLKLEFPDCWVNTHLAETPTTTRDVRRLFPTAKNYVDVYEMYDLVGPKFTGGHSVYLSDAEFKRLSEKEAAIAFCPCSNFFLGSGLFKLGECKNPSHPVRLGVGTDMGGGNTFSILEVLNDGYKVGMLNNLKLVGAFNFQDEDVASAERNKLSAYRALYLATLGGATALYIDEYVGSFDVGKEADFIVIDPIGGPPELLLRQEKYKKLSSVEDAIQILFGLMMLSSDRAVDTTYIMGEVAYQKSSPNLP